MPIKDPEKRRKYHRLWKRKRNKEVREEVLTLLGGKCVHCGHKDPRVLEIDHIEPIMRSKDERNLNLWGGNNLVVKIKRGDVDKKEVQLLCANCHKIKTIGDRLKFKNYIH